MIALTLDLAKSDKTDATRLRAVRVWLFVVAAMIAGMVLVGGATRLTESGLSIVEWKPIEGALPPLGDAQWNDAFEAYKKIPQYSAMNRGMSLAEFKTIFWWEWSHRLLGRLIGAAFLLPFLWFLARGAIPRTVRPRLWLIFALGALQGAVGWWMVASGLSERTEVSQYRLATHLILALVIYAAIVWTLRGLGSRVRVEVPRRLRVTSFVLLALTFIQIYFGALVAGLRAGLVYNTWPLIDGAFIPDSARLFLEQPAWRNFFDNTLTVQFTHRMIAYTLLAVAIAHVVDCFRARTAGFNAVVNGALVIGVAITLQIVLGILTLLNFVPIDIALSHQAVALVVLTATLVHAERLVAQDAGEGIAAI